MQHKVFQLYSIIKHYLFFSASINLLLQMFDVLQRQHAEVIYFQIRSKLCRGQSS